MKKSCPVCGIFQEDGWEIENTAEDRCGDKFPPQFLSLDVVRDGAGGPGDTLYRCPKCGKFYLHHRSTPGGSYDAFKTYFVERLTPLSPGEARAILEPKREEPAEVQSSLRCPACRSASVRKTGSAFIGPELFITFQCDNCGKEETVDEYQIDSWFG